MEWNSIIRLFAAISLIIGAIECFAGFKIMKAMMAIWGFFVGAMVGVVIGVVSDNTIIGVVVVVLLGGILAVLSYKLYKAGIFILTAFLSAVAAYIISESLWVSAVLAVVVGVLAILFIKPVVIGTTAISGAGIILSSAYIMMAMDLKANPVIAVVLWILLAVTGVAVQYITTQRQTGRPMGSPNPSRTFSERKYPGMQRAYRNFCIMCGYELQSANQRCPRCNYSYDD